MQIAKEEKENSKGKSHGNANNLSGRPCSQNNSKLFKRQEEKTILENMFQEIIVSEQENMHIWQSFERELTGKY